MDIPLRTLTEDVSLHNTVVLVRASLNVPLKDGQVADTYRLQRALPTIDWLRHQGAKVVVVGHIGRDPEATLYPVYEAMQAWCPIEWGGSVTDSEYQARVQRMTAGEVLLMENLRQDEREVANDPTFAAQLAAPVEIFVNDAFAVMHREHASVVGVPTIVPAYAGLQVVRELQSLQVARTPQNPSVFLLGGAKFATKLQLVEQYLDIYDTVFIGGALAHDVMLARGYEVGRSLVSDVSLVDKAFVSNERLVLPLDVVVKRLDGAVATIPLEAVEVTDTIFDCGPDTVAYLERQIAAAATVLWNGPFGNYEAGFTEGTEGVAQALADSAAASYVGGGDTVAAIEAIKRNDAFTFVSTGGGAMLAYLEHGTLPALPYLLTSSE